ncbi:PWWP domain-containing protein 1-like [Diospyros lotus]|uniref:PWWP domain-containing protein 1-like n=1 Tax=Diospyros lotus TaxID=55363 RepID=UPI00224DE54F|nr:PWWP domain-containing protein 1-like [Diospyros lotus]
MISVMSGNDFKADLIEDEAQSQGRVSVDGGGGGGVSSSNRANVGGSGVLSSDLCVSEGNRVSGNDFVVSSVGDSRGGSDEDQSLNRVVSEGGRIPVESDNQAPVSDFDGAFSVGGVGNLGNCGSDRIRVSEGDWRGADEDIDFWSSNSRNEDVIDKPWANSEEKGLVQASSMSIVHKIEGWHDRVEHSGAGKGHDEVEKSDVSRYESMISMFDEFAANGKGKTMGPGAQNSVGYGYEIGDMVWGKVKSHPWWPGHIYNEAFASPSVRRTKRAGHVLVAFFGDSSYGWFDPAELVPFDPNFSEKSRQTNSRTFVKAVEEATDEACRRRDLGLACKCRNPYNFRPTNSQGYFVVDVGDYEAGGVYSVNQIKQARDDFHPGDTLAFIKQLALMPHGGHGTIEFIKSKATLLAYRKTAFEEFDETYAQAFGQQPIRPTRTPMDAVTQHFRAPLSGPLVIAEALGKKKNPTKLSKPKYQANKDRYLFKRRDEPTGLKNQQIEQATAALQPAHVEGSPELAAGEYVLQRRDQAIFMKQQIPDKIEQMVFSERDGASVPNRAATGEEHASTLETVSGVNFSMASSLESGFKVEPSGSSAADGFSGKGAFRIDVLPNSENSGQVASMPRLFEGFQQPTSSATTVKEVHAQEQARMDGCGGHGLPPTDVKLHGQDSRMHNEHGAKKAKLLKRPVGELGDEKSAVGEKKKKRRKKELGVEMSSDRMSKVASVGKGGASSGRVPGKSVQVGLPLREDLQRDALKRDDVGSSTLPDSLRMPVTGMGSFELKIPQLLGDLQALALNPFHGRDGSRPAIIRQAFLKFRSLVYQKSLSLTASAEVESSQISAPKFVAVTSTGSDNLTRENVKDMTSSKPAKPLVRSDDPTKGGRKRSLSDRQEELAVKRLKKVSEMKSLAADKKATSKTSEAQREGKEMGATRPLKPLRTDPVKKMESPAKAPEPTMLVMKFPPQMSLPSGSELKVKLARFGQLDHSLTRIFWKSSTCRVVFIYKADAEAALRHLTGNGTLFGNVSLRCHIRPMAAAAPESESKVQREEGPMDSLQARDSAVEQRPPTLQPLQQTPVQLKSCLKKPGDEAAGGGAATGGGGSSRGARVKFMLGGGETSSSGGDQLMMVGSKNHNFLENATTTSFAVGGASSSSSSSSHGMDFISKNVQKVIPPSPLPPPIPAAPPHHYYTLPPNAPINLRYGDPAPTRNYHNFNPLNMAPPPPPPSISSSPNMDLGPHVLSLLLRCLEVVMGLRGSLGYSPLHPL